MPARPSLVLPLHPHFYRLFHISARLRLRDRPTPLPPTDDFYALLLSNPLPPTSHTINPSRAPTSSNPSSASTLPSPPSSPSAASPINQSRSKPIEVSNAGPKNQVLFSAPLAGPSARMRGLRRAESGLERPPEPDNCCMSGCVHCVWDAYREEVEEWAAVRQRKQRATERQRGRRKGEGREGVAGGATGDGGEGKVGDENEVGGLKGFEGVDLGDEGIFEGVPVGIREFMNTEKRLRERRGREGRE